MGEDIFEEMEKFKYIGLLISNKRNKGITQMIQVEYSAYYTQKNKIRYKKLS